MIDALTDPHAILAAVLAGCVAAVVFQLAIWFERRERRARIRRRLKRKDDMIFDGSIRDPYPDRPLEERHGKQ